MSVTSIYCEHEWRYNFYQQDTNTTVRKRPSRVCKNCDQYEELFNAGESSSSITGEVWLVMARNRVLSWDSRA